MPLAENERMNISVVIPTYNRPEQLEKAVQSLCEQTRKPENTIIVNDCSTESYKEVYSTIKDMDLKIQIVENNESRGGSGARNRGVDLVNKGIIMFLDDDDRWRSEKIKNQIKVFENRDSNLGLVYSGRAAVKEDGTVLYNIKPKHRGDLSEGILMKNLIGTTSSVAVPKESFEAVGGFNENLPALQDWDLWIRLLQQYEADFSPSVDVEWTVHEDSEGQIAGQPMKYMKAHEQIRSSYPDLFNSLTAINKRKAESYRYSSISDKFSNNNSKSKYYYATRSFVKFPNASAVSHCLPPRIVRKMRRVLPIS
ncbi:glycosyltransferase family 2 protein [Halostagnicola bangensis]